MGNLVVGKAKDKEQYAYTIERGSLLFSIFLLGFASTLKHASLYESGVANKDEVRDSVDEGLDTLRRMIVALLPAAMWALFALAASRVLAYFILVRQSYEAILAQET